MRGNSDVEGPVVETATGPVEGTTFGKGDNWLFTGIPYAKPPVGPLRWAPPQPHDRWSDTRLCVKPGRSPMQRAFNIDKVVSRFMKGAGFPALHQRVAGLFVQKTLEWRPQGEDCLTLEVRAPAHAERLPVMVWIHGGDHCDGTGSEGIYGTSALIRRGCVQVNINYRLGLMGFFGHRELNDESEHGVSGNYGLLDQIAALKWVQANIAGFGGDPDNVTIFGESAGGQAVLNLMTSPLARGLFHRAIAQSPADCGPWLHLDQQSVGLRSLLDSGHDFATRLVGPGPGQLGRLRALPAKDLYALYRSDADLAHQFYPCIDGYVRPTAPLAAFAAGEAAPVPFVAGFNSDEGVLMDLVHPAGTEFGFETPGRAPVTPAEARRVLEHSHGSAEAVDELFAAYPGLEKLDPSARAEHIRDHVFGVQADFAVRQHAAHGHPAYQYLFKAVLDRPSQTAGAFHAAEISYLFDSHPPVLLPKPADGQRLVEELGSRWVQFAATGEPNPAGRQNWPRFDPDNPHRMEFDRPTSAVEACPQTPGLAALGRRVERLAGLDRSPS